MAASDLLTTRTGTPIIREGGMSAVREDRWRLGVLVFFQTTCPTCQAVWPYLEKLYRTYRGAGLAVWGISQDPRDLTTLFVSQQSSTFPILIDAGLRVARAYAPEFVPTLLLVDRSNRILDRVVGLDKAKLNHLSQTIAGHLGVPATIVAPPDDGQPVFKPG
jgi:peroxiredoxin